MALEPTRGYTPSLSFEAPFGSRGGGGTSVVGLSPTRSRLPSRRGTRANTSSFFRPFRSLPSPPACRLPRIRRTRFLTLLPRTQTASQTTSRLTSRSSTCSSGRPVRLSGAEVNGGGEGSGGVGGEAARGSRAWCPPTALEHGVEDAWSDFQHVVWPFLRSWIQAMPNQVQGHATCNIKTRRAAAKEAARTKLTEPSDLKGGVAARTQWADLRWCWKVAAAAVEEGEAAAGDLGAAVVEALEGYEEARAYEEACFEDWQLANSRTSVRQYKLLELSKVMAERLLAQQGRRGEMSEVREDIVVSHGYDLLAGHLTKKRK
ncbi:hypothetical protein AAT19DRAFT_13753 [Rhodotorula toruloides]|uniref:Uncharacterized protein n=1 Tax=Rhodotorula toruloides TaxID=5286 RepID=A0A2T0ACG7_RHOTO|nr:hypothetical protein AAT19DRAFT_13753 [Rhodotorula toruloides]